MGLQRGQLQSCALIQVGKFFLVANQIHSRFTPVTAELCTNALPLPRAFIHALARFSHLPGRQR